MEIPSHFGLWGVQCAAGFIIVMTINMKNHGMGCRLNILKTTHVDMEFFPEKLTWLNILYNKMHCHTKNYFKLRKVKSEKKPLLSFDISISIRRECGPWGYHTTDSQIVLLEVLFRYFLFFWVHRFIYFNSGKWCLFHWFICEYNG